MIQLLKLARNERGSFLVQTLIGLGILGILTAALISFLQFSTGSQRRLKSLQAFNDQVSIAQLNIDDVKACTYNFGTVTDGVSTLDGITLPPIDSEIDVDIKKYNSDSPTLARATAPSVFHQADGSEIDLSLKVVSVKLRTVAKISPNRYVANIVVKGDRASPGSPSDEISQGFPIYIATDSVQKVLFCYGNYASGGLADLQQKQCELLMGAGYYWNPKKNACDTRFEVKCFPGTSSTTASCDPATTFGVGGYPVCQASGYNDPTPTTTLPPRIYTSGAELSPQLPGPYTCHTVGTNTVTCDYAIGVDSSGATCSACCNVEKADAIAASPISGP